MLTKFDPTNLKACLSLLEDITSNANQIQDSVLEAILTRNAHTEYLRGFLNGQVDKQSFKNNLPIVTYEDYHSYIDRIANGEPFDLICDRPIIVLLASEKNCTSLLRNFTWVGQTQSMYCQLLCGLVERGNVSRLGAPFASTFLKVIKFLENHWSELCSNIRTGRVSDWITDANCVSGIGKFLEAPNPELASLIEQECSKTSWEAIVRRLWPNAKCIEAVVTGSECSVGLNLDPLSKPCDVSYTTIPSMAYFEFFEIKKYHQETGHDPVVVDLVDVKVGHDYEPVITTFSGLYRYRLGDVLRVTGFYNNAPQFRFVGRQKVVLSIDMDKTYEEDLLKAVANAKLLLEPHELMLIDFTSRVDSSSFPGHYVLYWELGCKVKDVKVEPDPEVMEECCFAVEECLDSVYRNGRRNDKNIGPLEIKVVRSGAFDELMSFFVSRGSSVSQFKTPRSLTNEEALKILEATVVSKFVSRKVPSWELHELHSSR
ncbi:hypothetical protein BRARA_G00204 [Brassica rapa]|uniref:Uncharacterized protein n=1 Tax=Brassica campestris TaxID=3711 RepID=A0A397YLF8_BRACM|nr:hypothetical protein BRARA_G00204 [Brassica rapa]